jgi:hypothetical protein
MFGRRSNRSLAITLLVALLPCPRAARAYVAIVNKTDHSEIHVVPPPGKVVIDGKLDDWDLSGAITMFIDEASKASYSVRGAMMYDKEFLYVGARVKDPTPMMNNYSFGGEASKAWDADAIQIFLVSNPDLKSNASLQTGGRMSPEDQQFVTTFWLWYSTQDKAPGFFSLRTLQYQNPTLNPPGVEKAIVKDEDGKGYTMEYRIPWKVLRTPREIVPGDTMQCQWQLMWGNDRGTATRCGMTDVRRGTSGDLGYMGPSSWGTAIFEKEGNLKLVEKSSSGSRADGFIPVAFTLDKPAKVSLAICNAEGRLIRTGLGAQPYPAGPQTWMWDGLDDADKPVPAGSYTAKILTHDGIGQKFVCDVGVSGTPPYQTEDGTGGWAGDYRYPQTMAIDGDCVILGTAIAEASQPTIRTDLDGRKKFGTAVAGHAVALHKGFGYTLSAGGARITKFSLENGMLAPFTTGRPETAVPGMRPGESGQDWAARSWQLHGIAAVGDQLVVSSLTDDKLFLLDLASGAPRGEAALPKPYGLAVGPGGGLYAVSGKAVGRYDLKAQQFTAFAENLEEPKHLAVDGAGNVYVSLHGKTMQVWKIAPDGKVLLKYGIAGGRPEVGKFNPAGMLKPWNVAVDKNGRLWVAEADSQPKRYSVWNPDGTLWKEFFGSMDYSTTAYLDPAKPEFIYAQCVRYRVDYDKGTWYPDATILRKRDEAGVPLGAPDAHGGAVIRTVKGRTFFLVGSLGLTIYEQVGDAYVPRLASFTATKEKIPLGKDGKPNPKAKPRPTKVPSLWVDDDNDGQVEPEEVRETDAPWTYMWTPCVDAEMNLYQPIGNRWAAQGGAKTTQPYGIARWTFQGFNDKGGLVYGKVTDVATDPDGGAVAEAIPDATNGSMVALVSGGSLERGQRPQGSGHRVVMFSPDGKKRWEYQNVHCAFAWTGDAYTPGHLTGAMVFVRGTTPDLVGVTGYYGQYFLLDKQDGLFVDALGEDQRSVYKLDQHMVLTENFNGTMFRHPQNGKTYFLGGDADLRLWELTGLDTMKRQSLQVTVAPEQVAKAAAASKQNFLAGQIAVGKKTAKLPRLKKAAADGTYDEWQASQPLTICMEGNRTAQAQLGYDDQSLHVRFQVSDESPFVNTPTDPRLLFKSGDAVEVNLATDLEKRPVRGQNQQQMKPGDVRIIVARTAVGDLVATRYRYVTTEKEKPNTFSVETKSSGKDTLDDVAVWTELPVNASVQKDGYVVEVAIPWKDLGIEPKPGLALSGDLGVIYGNEGGTKNAIRYLWSDKSPEVSINNDIPSEIRIHPNQWGGWMLE